MENRDSRVTLPKRSAASDLWVGIIGAIMDIYSAENEYIYLILNDRRCLLTGCHCPNYTRKNNIKVWKGRSLGFLVLVSGHKAIVFSLLRVAHLYSLPYS